MAIAAILFPYALFLRPTDLSPFTLFSFPRHQLYHLKISRAVADCGELQQDPTWNSWDWSAVKVPGQLVLFYFMQFHNTLVHPQFEAKLNLFFEEKVMFRFADLLALLMNLRGFRNATAKTLPNTGPGWLAFRSVLAWSRMDSRKYACKYIAAVTSTAVKS